MAGTTVRDDDFVSMVLQEALAADGVHASREALTGVMGWPKPAAIGEMLVRYAGGADAERVERLFQEFLRRMKAFYTGDPRVQEIGGVSALFASLRAHGVRVALDTGFSREIAALLISRLGWEDLIDFSITSDEVERGRPFPDMTLKAMEVLGIADPAQVAKLGDTLSDLQSGHAAGCGWVIGVLSGANTRAELEALPHTHILDSVADLRTLWGLGD
jgi:phosphonatase-like hydrolase